MLYLLFGCLLISGAIIAVIISILLQKRNMVDAVVLESSSIIEKSDKKILRIEVKHRVEINLSDEKKDFITDQIFIRKKNGTVEKLYFDQKEEKLYYNPRNDLLPVVCSMFVAGVMCIVAYFCIRFGLNIEVSNERLLLCLLFAVMSVYFFTGIGFIGRHVIVKMNGHFEGILYVSKMRKYYEIYSLNYNDYQQYGRRIESIFPNQRIEKNIILYFNTRTGTVQKKTDIIGSVCLGVLAAVTAVLFIIL